MLRARLRDGLTVRRWHAALPSRAPRPRGQRSRSRQPLFRSAPVRRRTGRRAVRMRPASTHECEPWLRVCTRAPNTQPLVTERGLGGRTVHSNVGAVTIVRPSAVAAEAPRPFAWRNERLQCRTRRLTGRTRRFTPSSLVRCGVLDAANRGATTGSASTRASMVGTNIGLLTTSLRRFVTFS